MDTRETENRVTRRRALLELGGFAAGAIGVGAIGAKELLDAEQAVAAGSGPAAVASGLVTCVLAPEMTEGPYYVEGDKVRRNITEGKPGVPLTLRLTVVDVSSCKPIKGAAVDIWHCDSGGTYSATSQQNTEGLTFLRGIQRTDKNGLALFKTIYPGWYPGRAVHIHLKVYLGGTTVHTGQLFFPDKLTDTVYKRAPYNQRPNRDPRNAADSIYRNGGARSTLSSFETEAPTSVASRWVLPGRNAPRRGCRGETHLAPTDCMLCQAAALKLPRISSEWGLQMNR